MPLSASSREGFATRAGFILAAAGSAIGLGNMWRFSYQASEGGGAAFVLLYIVLTIILGIPLMLAEFGVGRRGQLGPIGSLRELAGPAWGRLGYIFAAGGFLILTYYSVIAGWTVRFAIESVLRGFPEDASAHFQEVATGPDAIGFHLLFMAVTVFVVMGGIKGGIERACLILMPMLFLIVVGLALWAATLDGATAGYTVYLRPDLAEMMNPAVWRAAAAQAFFSLSLGMGCMLTFASYLHDEQNLPQSATIVAFSDFGVAFVAGLVVFPVIYSFGLQGAVGGSTVGALFIALPSAFEAMGTVGHAVGLFFFFTLAVAALTSAISLLEVVTATLIDERHVSRRKAAAGAGALIAACGILPALNLDALGIMDQIAGELLLVVGSLVVALLVGWVARRPIETELLRGASPYWAAQVPRILLALRFIVPLIVGTVLYFSLRSSITAIAALFGI